MLQKKRQLLAQKYQKFKISKNSFKKTYIFKTKHFFFFIQKILFAKTFKTFHFCIFSCKKHHFSLARPYFYFIYKLFFHISSCKNIAQKLCKTYLFLQKYYFLQIFVQFSLARPYFYHIYKLFFSCKICLFSFLQNFMQKINCIYYAKIKSNSHTALQFLHLLCMV